MSPVCIRTAPQNSLELAAVVSFRDDDIKWGRIEVSWWVNWFLRTNRKSRPSERYTGIFLFKHVAYSIIGEGR